MLTYKGPHYEYKDVPIALRPLQQPHPPFWYGSSNTTGSTFAGERGMHFVSLGPTGFARKNIDAFRAALAKRGGPANPKPEFSGGTAVGVLRHIFVAETDAEAKRWAKPAMDRHLAHLELAARTSTARPPPTRASTCRAAPTSRPASPTAR